MKTANDFAQAAQAITQQADEMHRAEVADKYKNARNLVVYHLRSAATTCKAIAQDLAARETT